MKQLLITGMAGALLLALGVWLAYWGPWAPTRVSSDSRSPAPAAGPSGALARQEPRKPSPVERAARIAALERLRPTTAETASHDTDQRPRGEQDDVVPASTRPAERHAPPAQRETASPRLVPAARDGVGPHDSGARSAAEEVSEETGGWPVVDENAADAPRANAVEGAPSVEPSEAEQIPVQQTPTAREVSEAFFAERRKGRLDEAALREWRERLIEAAVANPDDPWSAEAFRCAADMHANDPPRMEELLRACIEHPRVGPTTKLMALIESSTLAACREDLVQAFADYNLIVETIPQEEDPAVRESWEPYAYWVLVKKASTLNTYMGLGWTIPALPGADFGKQASDYYQEFLEKTPPEMRALGLLSSYSDLDIWTAQAQAFVREGQGERAAENYRKILAHPDNPHPATQVRFWEAEALHPDHGPEFTKALEEIERTLPRDSWSRDLSYRVAWSYYERGSGQGYIDRVEPLLRSDDAEDRAFINDEGPGFRAAVLYFLAESYSRSDVQDYGRAVAYYEQLLGDFPDYQLAAGVYLDLGYLYQNVGDDQRAIQCWERFLSEFPNNRNVDSVRRSLERLYEKVESERRARADNDEDGGREEENDTNDLP